MDPDLFQDFRRGHGPGWEPLACRHRGPRVRHPRRPRHPERDAADSRRRARQGGREERRGRDPMSSGRMPLQDLQWPNNARVAVTVSVGIEVWSENATPGANSPGGFLSGGGKGSHTRDIRVEKMVEYGTNVGAWKLLEILDQERGKASGLLSGRA